MVTITTTRMMLLFFKIEGLERVKAGATYMEDEFSVSIPEEQFDVELKHSKLKRLLKTKYDNGAMYELFNQYDALVGTALKGTKDKPKRAEVKEKPKTPTFNCAHCGKEQKRRRCIAHNAGYCSHCYHDVLFISKFKKPEKNNEPKPEIIHCKKCGCIVRGKNTKYQYTGLCRNCYIVEYKANKNTLEPLKRTARIEKMKELVNSGS